MDVTRYIAGLSPGDTMHIPCTNVLCMTRTLGHCLECETPWIRCGCGEHNFDCECGGNIEFIDLYLQRRVLALEEAIRSHRKATGRMLREADRILYALFDSV